MNKYKVSELAKDLGITSKELSALLLSLTGKDKKSGAVLENDEIGLLFDAVTKNNQVKSFDDYFATGAQVRKAKAEKRQSEKDKKLAEQMAILEQLKAAAAAEEAKNAPKEAKKE